MVFWRGATPKQTWQHDCPALYGALQVSLRLWRCGRVGHWRALSLGRGFRNGQGDVKRDVSNLNPPETSKVSGFSAKRVKVTSDWRVTMWEKSVFLAPSTSCSLTLLCLRRVLASVRGRCEDRQLHTLSKSVPECLSFPRARPQWGRRQASSAHHRGPRPGWGHWWASTIRRGRTLLVLVLFLVLRFPASQAVRNAIASSRVNLNSVLSIHIR